MDLLAQKPGDAVQDAGNLGLFLLLEPHEIVVLRDNRERLDEERLAAGRQPVNDPGNLSSGVDADGYDEAAVPEGDNLLLNGVWLALQNRLQVAVNPLPCDLHLAPDRAQLGAGVVGDLTPRQDPAFYLGDSRTEIGDLRSALV